MRGRSLGELRVRGEQALSAFAERRGWSQQTRLPSDRSLRNLTSSSASTPSEIREQFSSRTTATFFAGVTDRKRTIETLTTRWPESCESILRRADRIISGRFDLLGYETLSFGDPIDWHFEPVSGKRAPFVHWSEFNELDANSYGDQKIVRELGRQQYFVTLGQGYWLTADERYAKTFVTHIDSWMNNNPPKIGTHWGSSLEIAFRSISWLWSLYMFKDSEAFGDEVFARVIKFLYLNARHLETYLSTYFSPNTHLTGEALGLVYIGTLLPDFRDAARWRNTGQQVLLEQLPRQIRPDGVYFEQSSYYHRYTADIYTHFLILSRNNGVSLPSHVPQRLELMMEHLMYITRPDGTTPFFGDDDGGRVVFLDASKSNDFRSVLSNGAALFSRSDFKFVGGAAKEATLWLLGADGLEDFDRLQPKEPEHRSIGFRDSGYYVMRDNWTRYANYMLFDCGLHGGSSCGHAHADALSFEVATNGHTLLMDPGTYTYTASAELRDWFRSSMGHNTVTVDGESSSVVAGPFAWSDIAQCRCLNWISKDRFDFVSGTHDGYSRLPNPLTHTRTILFLKGDYWIIQDELASAQAHEATLWLHFAPGVVPGVSQTRNGQVNLREQGVDIELFAARGSWKEEKAWVSHCYGSKEEASVLGFSTDAPEMITFLVPQILLGGSRATIRKVETIGGTGYEVARSGGVDVLMIKDRSASRVETARLASDFQWTWARFAMRDENMPTELLLLSGSTLQLQGREILRTSTPLEYLVARRVDNQFTIETDHGVIDLRLPARDFASAFSRLSDSEISS